MIDDARADVEEHDLRIAWRGRQTEPLERIKHGKRLHRLLRIGVEADVLVREVEPGTDDRHASHGTGREQPTRLHRRQRLLDGIVGNERRVERQTARAEQPGPPDKLGQGVAAARCAEFLIDLVLFGCHADHRRKQIISCRLPLHSGREAKPFSLKKRAGEQPALVIVRGGQSRQKIVEAGRDQLNCPAQHQLPIPRRARFDCAEHRAWSRGKRRTEQHPVDNGVFVALVEPRADLAILALDPARPCGFHPRWAQVIELGWKLTRQLGQNRPGFTKTDESSRSDGGRRACRDQQQDADNPNVSVKNASILSVSMLTTLVMASAEVSPYRKFCCARPLS